MRIHQVFKIRFIPIFSFFILLNGFSCVWAKGSEHQGQTKALVCSACHGLDGISTNPVWPNLAGQHALYLIEQLKHYKLDKVRNNAIMTSMVAGLNDQDMEDLAAFYTQKPLAKPISNADGHSVGEHLYRQGDLKRHIPACIACHGPDGRGAEQAGFPVISHQQQEYVVQQLQAFQSKTRASDPNAIMRTISEKLTLEEMQSLATYLAQLP